MKNLLIAALLLSPLTFASAQTADDWYASLHFGKGWKGDAAMDFMASSAVRRAHPVTGEPVPWFTVRNHFQADLDYSSGWGIGASVGRGFGDWRVEGELLWRKSRIGGFDLSGYDFEIDPADAMLPPGLAWSDFFSLEMAREQINEETVDLSGRVSLFSTTLNLIYDLPVEWALRPYAGVGLGALHANKKKRVAILSATASGECSPDMPCVGSDSHSRSWDFTWQAMAGVRYPLNDLWDLTLGWRYASLSNLKFSMLEDAEELGAFSDDPLQVQLDGMHSVELGVIRRF